MNIKLSNEVLYPSVEQPLPQIWHRIGNVYFIDDVDSGDEFAGYFLLAQVAGHIVAFIGLDNTANRWSNPLLVKDINRLSQKEFEKLFDARWEGDTITYIGQAGEVLSIISEEKERGEK